MSAKRGLKLGHLISGVGHGWGAWRHPGAQIDAGTSFEFFATRAKAAERGKFDYLFLADGVSTNAGAMPQFLSHFEPLTIMSALAAVTHHIGLVGTYSVSYSDPYNLARQLATLDKISAGRAGWNVVTTPSEAAAGNFGRSSHYPHDLRYRRAAEFVEVVRGLWDSFEPGAIVGDKAAGVFLDPTKLHALNHHGEFFDVAGPLNIDRTPQGYPVTFQAGTSEAGRDFAARYADAIFVMLANLAEAQAFRSDLRHRAQAIGRDPDQIFVMTGISTVVAASDAEVDRLVRERADLSPIEGRVAQLSRFFDGYDFSAHELDAPFPELSLEKPLEGWQGRVTDIVKAARDGGLTLRETAIAFGSPTGSFDGTPERVADAMQHWFEAGGADGFMVTESLPGQFDIFVDQVVPVLQRRGLFRLDYEGVTLRENFGIDVPANRYVAAVS